MRNHISSARAAQVIAVIIGIGVFAIGLLSDAILLRMKPHPLWVLVDDFAIGVFAAAIVLLYEQRRVRELRRKFANIHQTNHEIRNQLEIIEYSAWTTHDPELIAQLHASVGRIDWALREILGKEDDSGLPARDTAAEVHAPSND